MKDYNFFSIYAKRKANSFTRMLPALIVIAAVLVAVVGTYIGLSLKLSSVRRDIASIDEYLNSEEVVTTFAEINRYTENNATLRRYEAAVETVSQNLFKADCFCSETMDKICAALPGSAVLDSILVVERDVSMTFSVDTFAASAQLTAALDSLDCFEKVNIITAESANSGKYSVTVSAVLKGGEAQ